ncbi:MAG: GGDEF domain-containing protein [Lachnospiraceae bacterium]|nr:GGDEF domain-containing protein [Lachnospiraceae bacterium]
MQSVKIGKGILFKSTVVLLIFTVSILITSGVTTYFSQMKIYKNQCEQNIRDIGEYLAALIENDWADFETYQNYYMAHFDEVKIPIDFTDYTDAAAEFERLFTQTYPGKVFQDDITFEKMTPEVQEAYFIYRHEYWLLTFEKAREAFGIPYSYYLVMKDDVHNVVYMIDGERTTPNDHLAEGEIPDPENEKWIYLGDEYYNDPDNYEIMWRTWETGVKQKGYLEFDNSWGHTYCYYTPLVIDGKKLGLIGTEINVATVNHDILMNTLQQLAYITLVFIVGMVLMLLLLNILFISKTRKLEQRVTEYSENKDGSLSGTLEREFRGSDELDLLGQRFAVMIRELENHMQSLIKATHDLAVSQQHAAEMDDLTNKDVMTGVRNKSAYEKEVQRMERNIREGRTEFGIAMVDLNNLKQINDTMGHEKGDMAIIRLCRFICRTFSHSAVFRISGDEFAVILMNDDYRYAESLVSEFIRKLEEAYADTSLEEWERSTAAIGYALYDPETDDSFAAAFRRADAAMYEKKRQMKALRAR